MSDDYYNGLPPGGDMETGGQPYTFKRGAMATKSIDYSEFNGIIAEQLLRQLGGERTKRAVMGLIRQGATKQQIVGNLLKLLPTWEGTAVQLGVIVDYLQGNGEAVE